MEARRALAVVPAQQAKSWELGTARGDEHVTALA